MNKQFSLFQTTERFDFGRFNITVKIDNYGGITLDLDELPSDFTSAEVVDFVRGFIFF